MKINTNNNITAPLPRRSDVVYENHVSGWHNRWLAWLILCISLGLGLGFASDIQAGNRKGSCGGNDERPCTLVPNAVDLRNHNP